MLKYCLGFVVINDKILLLNRNRKPWQGCWNGIGGHLEMGENGYQAMQRELLEESNLEAEKIIPRGILTWEGSNEGIYLYLIYPKFVDFTRFPCKIDEGILDFKSLAWIKDSNNLGINYNLPFIFDVLFSDNELYHFHSVFGKDSRLLSITKKNLEENYFKELG